MKKVLIVLTNVGKYEKSNRLIGLWLGELTHFYEEVKKVGLDVDFVSPKGGYIPLDPHGLQFMDETDYKYYADEDFKNRALANTLKPSQVKSEDYNVIYYTGGHGTMWDFPSSEKLAEIAQEIHSQGGYITAVCHGVAGLLPIKNDDGTPFINGKVLTGFTNEEEVLNGTTDIVPFLTEDALKEKGARVEIETAYTPVVRKDGRLLTGQNPQSVRRLGQFLVEVLKDDGVL